MAAITLEHVTKEFAAGVVAVDDVNLTIEDGEFMVLVGPSGCGKSTLLRMIAGLEEITDGTISIGDRDVTELAPPERDIAMVFQNYALYPHMSVRQNLGFGLSVRHTPKAEIARRVGDVATLLGLENLLDRKPAHLSGGQRQRVAMGRAIIREPVAFLMDEPLSNLDAKLRVGMRASLAQLHARLSVTSIYVTHDQTEAMTLGQRVAVMRDGRVVQVDVPQRLYQSPNDLFVAAFIGSPSMNLVEATVEDDVIAFGQFRVPLAPARRPPRDVTEVVLGIRPEAFDDAAFARTLPPGASADIEVILSGKSDVLRIPAYALLEGKRVLLLADDCPRGSGLGGALAAILPAGPGGCLVSRDVRIGLKNWEFAEVREGLKEGERVVVSLDRAEVKEGARARQAAVTEK